MNADAPIGPHADTASFVVAATPRYALRLSIPLLWTLVSLSTVIAVLYEQIPELVLNAGTVLTSAERLAYFGDRALKEFPR